MTIEPGENGLRREGEKLRNVSLSVLHYSRPPSNVGGMRHLQLDLADPVFIQDPYPALSEMREFAPVIRDESSGLFLITRHEDVRACLRDRRLGRVYDHIATTEEIGAQPRDQRWAPFWQVEKYSLLELEPPDHTRIRRLVAKAFTVRAVEAMRKPAEDLARRLLDHAQERDQIDLLADFAQPYSIGIITTLLGVPSADHQRLLEWSHRMVKMYELNTSDDQAQAAADAAAAFDGYVREIVEQHRTAPRGGLIGELVRAEIDGERLTDEEIVSTVIVLLNAGHEATVNTIGNGITAFMENRQQWRRVVDGRVPPAIAVEEMIRWDAPLQLFERWVLSDDVEIAGTRFTFGDKIGMLFGSANRDPRAFRDPDSFVAERNAVNHIGFGGGTHHCLGAPLARLELDVALTALVESNPNLELADQPVRQNAFSIHGYESVPVRVGH